jgi:hypothetical protein
MEGLFMTNKSLERELREKDFVVFVREFDRLRDVKAKAQSEYYNYDCTDSNSSFDFEEFRVLEENYDKACKDFDSMSRVLASFVADNFGFIAIH